MNLPLLALAGSFSFGFLAAFFVSLGGKKSWIPSVIGGAVGVLLVSQDVGMILLGSVMGFVGWQAYHTLKPKRS